MSKHKFISQYGAKIFGANDYTGVADDCDQRAPINEISDMWQQFIVPEDLMDEIENETIDDFDNDIYPYTDISEIGEDILTAAQPEIASIGRRLTKRRK